LLSASPDSVSSNAEPVEVLEAGQHVATSPVGRLRRTLQCKAGSDARCRQDIRRRVGALAASQNVVAAAARQNVIEGRACQVLNVPQRVAARTAGRLRCRQRQS